MYFLVLLHSYFPDILKRYLQNLLDLYYIQLEVFHFSLAIVQGDRERSLFLSFCALLK